MMTMAENGSTTLSSASTMISSDSSASSPKDDREESLSSYLIINGSKLAWLGSFQDLIYFASQYLDLNRENSKVSDVDNKKTIKTEHLIISWFESTRTLLVQGSQAADCKAFLNELIADNSKNLSSRHLDNTSNANNDDLAEFELASAEVNNIVTPSEFSRKIGKNLVRNYIYSRQI